MEVGRRHPLALPKGGILATGENDTGVIRSLISSLGKKILAGDFVSLMNVSKPASISYPMTYLQVMIQDFIYTDFLVKAAESSDPLERLQYVAAFIISGMHNAITTVRNKAPMNPILGETLHATKSDGTKIYCEQISHHPPVSAWEMFGKGYYFNGQGQVKVGLNGPNSINSIRDGLHQIVFDDGAIIEFNVPAVKVDGLVVGTRILNYHQKFTIHYESADMCAEVTLNPQPKKFMGIFSRSSKLPTDNFVVEFYQGEGNERELLSKGSGSWLESLEYDGNEIWNVFEPQDEWDYIANLPSDSSYRKDVSELKAGNLICADTEKEKLENRQRADKALREAHK